jgi:hypothetical protein
MSLKYYKLLFITYSIWLIFSCDSKKTEYSKDFSFKIIETTSEYNSKTGIYTRQYIYKDSSVNVKLNENEIQKIQKLIVDLDFKNFPEKFECSKNSSFIMPSFDTTIETSINGRLKKTTNTSYCDTKVQQEMSDNFEKIALEINRILDSKKEIKDMRQCDMIFL